MNWLENKISKLFGFRSESKQTNSKKSAKIYAKKSPYDVSWTWIRDYIIPSGSIVFFSNYLDANYEYVKGNLWLVELFYGAAVSYHNIQIISRLNLFVHEYNIKGLNKLNILREIYNADCREEYYQAARLEECRISFIDWEMSEQIQSEYIHKYWNMFEYL